VNRNELRVSGSNNYTLLLLFSHARHENSLWADVARKSDIVHHQCSDLEAGSGPDSVSLELLGTLLRLLLNPVNSQWPCCKQSHYYFKKIINNIQPVSLNLHTAKKYQLCTGETTG